MRCLRPKLVKNPRTGHYVNVPCHTCPACIHNRQKEWAFRLMIEAKYSPNLSYFLTLTFDDSKILHNPSLASVLDRVYFTKFVKRLCGRFVYHSVQGTLRYFGCGEYGSLGRAHYHVILFDCALDSDELRTIAEDCWKVGFVTCEPVTDARCMYVAKYTCKALFDLPEYEGKPKPFASMTRVPALGSALLMDKNLVQRIKDEQMFTVYSENGSAFNIPRLYKDFIFSSRERELHTELLRSNDVLERALGTSSYNDILQSQIQKSFNDESLFFKRLRQDLQLRLGTQQKCFSQADA